MINQEKKNKMISRHANEPGCQTIVSLKVVVAFGGLRHAAGDLR